MFNPVTLLLGVWWGWTVISAGAVWRGWEGTLDYPVTLVINVTKTSSPQTIAFDACQVLPCGDLETQRLLSQADKYVCPEPGTGYSTANPCPVWDRVWRTTPFQDWPVGRGWVNVAWKPLKAKIHLFKGIPPRPCENLKCNPLFLTINDPAALDREPNVASRVYGLGANAIGRDPQGRNVTGRDFLGRFLLKLVESKNPNLLVTTPAGTPNPREHAEQELPHNDPKLVTVTEVKDVKQTLEIETGYGEASAWLEWVMFTVRDLNKSGCYACATGRPQAQVVPFPLGWDTDPTGVNCMLALFQDKDAWGNETCQSLSLLFPALETGPPEPPPFSVGEVDMSYSLCLTRQGDEFTYPVGDLRTCAHVLDISSDGRAGSNFSALNVSRADVWWYCGQKDLYSSLPPDWYGTCALVQLAIPFTLAFGSVPGAPFDTGSVRVPRVVPSESKARNWKEAGSESGLFWWTLRNSTVDWIDYIYDNKQKFMSYPSETLRRISNQLNESSRMAWEDRIASDMMLAERGGACVMLGGECCTFIPSGTAPDGSIIKALQGLNALAGELAETSGANAPFRDGVEGWFGKQKALALSVLASLLAASRV